LPFWLLVRVTVFDGVRSFRQVLSFVETQFAPRVVMTSLISVVDRAPAS
jgi:hypothetical protein